MLFQREPLSEVASVYAAIQIGRCSMLAVYVIEVYEWLLTFADEVELIHCSRWSSMKFAYLICRYYPLLVSPFHLWAWIGDHTLETCERVVRPVYVTLVPLQLSAQAVIMYRAWAFTGRSKLIFAVLITGYVVVCAVQFWLIGFDFILTGAHTVLGNTGCFGDDEQVVNSASSYFRAVRTGSAFLSSFLLDALAMGLVFVYSLRVQAVQGKLGRAFVYQGAGVFAIMSVLNLMTAAFYYQPSTIMDGHGLPYAFMLSDIFACRLILLLRRHTSPTETMQLEEQSRVVREGLRAAAELPPFNPDPWGS